MGELFRASRYPLISTIRTWPQNANKIWHLGSEGVFQNSPRPDLSATPIRAHVFTALAPLRNVTIDPNSYDRSDYAEGYEKHDKPHCDALSRFSLCHILLARSRPNAVTKSSRTRNNTAPGIAELHHPFCSIAGNIGSRCMDRREHTRRRKSDRQRRDGDRAPREFHQAQARPNSEARRPGPGIEKPPRPRSPRHRPENLPDLKSLERFIASRLAGKHHVFDRRLKHI
jgi:hypothetical protein